MSGQAAVHALPTSSSRNSTASKAAAGDSRRAAAYQGGCMTVAGVGRVAETGSLSILLMLSPPTADPQATRPAWSGSANCGRPGRWARWATRVWLHLTSVRHVAIAATARSA